MSTMIEKVARAIEPETFRRQDIAIQFLKSAGREWEGSPEQETHRIKIAAAHGRARAAIEVLGCFESMIQAALNEETQG